MPGVNVAEALPECINEELSIETFDGLIVVIEGFLTSLPKFADPTVIVPKIPDFPGAALEILFEGFDKASLPAFSLEEPARFSFDGQLEIPNFSPDGMIALVTGLVNIAIGIPELFIDLEAKPPVPKIPTYDAIVQLVGIQLGLQIDDLIITEDFAVKFGECIAQVTAETLGVST